MSDNNSNYTTFGFRIDRNLKAEARKVAELQHRTLSGLVLHLLSETVSKHNAKHENSSEGK